MPSLFEPIELSFWSLIGWKRPGIFISNEPSGGPKGARSATIFSSRCFKSIFLSICESLHYASVPSACFFESKDFTVDIIYFDRTILWKNSMFEPIVFVTKIILKYFLLWCVKHLDVSNFFGVPAAYIPIFFHQTDFYSCFHVLNKLKCSITLVCLRPFSLNPKILQWMFLIIIAWSDSFFAVLNTSKFSTVLVGFWLI